MLVILLLVFFINLYHELIYRRSLKSILVWLISQPLNVIINCLIDFTMVGILSLIILPKYALIVVFLINTILALSNKHKMDYRGDNFFPWDLKLLKETSDMSSFLGIQSLLMDCLTSVLIILLIVMSVRNQSIDGGILMISIFFTTVLFIMEWWSHKLPVQNQHAHYAKKGVKLAFLLNLKEMIIFDKYQRKQRSTLKAPANKDQNLKSSQKPNMIVIMNESFWDPTRLDHITWSKNLTPTLDQLRQRSWFGELVSPEFGGGTSNIEFEVLTGQNMYFLPTGIMAYQSMGHRKIESLPFQFRESGYQSLALHPYLSWFWNRENVYESMGFHSFLSLNDFTNPEHKGGYVSDRAFVEKVIEIYEQTNEPLFLYGITMQNHGPYTKNRYDHYDIKVSGPLSSKELEGLQCYAQGVYDADRSLKYLIDYFEKQEHETQIVFFGDHLPMLGNQFSTYKKCHYIKTRDPFLWGNDEKLKMASTPFVIWSNKKSESKDLGCISPTNLGIQILNSAGIDKSEYFSSVETIYKALPVINKRVMNADNLSPFEKKVIQDCSDLQK